MFLTILIINIIYTQKWYIGKKSITEKILNFVKSTLRSLVVFPVEIPWIFSGILPVVGRVT